MGRQSPHFVESAVGAGNLNKRAGFVTAVTFLQINGRRLEASEVDATLRTLALAAGELSEAGYAKWLKENSSRA